MSHQSFNSEAQFENALISMLTQYGWEKEVLRNPTEQDLIRNWADILYQNNRDAVRLGNYPLTETEMQQIIDNINTLHTPLALNEFINGGTTTIKRDNPDDVANFGKNVTLKIYDRREIAGGQSRYQIVQQPKFPTSSPLLNNRRGDLMLLINGMPVFHIELKKSGVDVSQASNQIEKYSREGIFSQGIFSLVQIFVAMNPEETLYFANPGSEGMFNNKFFFHWADFYNEPVNYWEQIAKQLLSIPMAHQLIGFYTIPDKKDGVLKVMRSYQYYAANAISNKVAKTHWEDKTIYGGYVWHTTGSGKTMTSFKSAQLIANSGDADKVVFLMDRIELGTQSLDEYQGFAGDEDNVEGTENTRKLVEKLESDSRNLRLIVSSIQKMGLVFDQTPGEEGGYPKQRLDKIRKKRIVFIIDECHRSTFGETLAEIKNNFPNALYFGFTGTPIEDANSIRNMTTSDLFGERLHLYSIADGIRDGNVLGFDPDMAPTMRDSDIRNAVALAKAKARNLDEVYADKAKQKAYDAIMALPMIYTKTDAVTGRYPDGVEDLLPEENYRLQGHREKVVEDIVREFPRLSANRKFHSILATSSIIEAIEYYRLLKGAASHLKVTAVFDPSIDNNGAERAMIKEDGLKEILTDYNNRFGQNFSIPTWQAFKKDVARRMSHKKPYQRIDREGQLDIMIVVDQMLTGFDSKWVNTLFLDKVLAYEGLIQAFSRTNRTFDHDKKFGNIRYYRRPYRMKRNIEKAFELYAQGKEQGVFVSKIGLNINGMNDSFKKIESLFKRENIENFAKLPGDTLVCARFAKLWRELNGYHDAAKMQGFTWERKRYKWTDEEGSLRYSTIAFEEISYRTLAQRYKELHNGGGGGEGIEEAPYEIEPYLMHIDTGMIDSEYLNSRFKKYLKAFYSEEEEQTLEDVSRELHKSFASLTADDQKYAGIFLNDIQQGKVTREDIDPGKSLNDYIQDYRTAAKNDQIHRFAVEFGVDEEKLREIIALNLPEDNLNMGGYFNELKDTVDKSAARELINRLKGRRLPPPIAWSQAEALLREFIIRGGFELDEKIEINPYQTPPSVYRSAAEQQDE